jgi:transcription elongation factor Elf1
LIERKQNSNGTITITVSFNLDPKRDCGTQFDNYGKCPKCGSTNTGLISTVEEQDLSGFYAYECLLCGAQWVEFCHEHEAEKKGILNRGSKSWQL